ncbi:TPA: DUF1889 family protein [Escherichia coli]
MYGEFHYNQKTLADWAERTETGRRVLTKNKEYLSSFMKEGLRALL